MCGFIGIAGAPGSHVAPELYEGLIALQHRGQDAAGILSYDGMFHLRKQNGMVRDIFRTRDMQRLKGNLAIAHVRYPTVGGGSGEDPQPFHLTFPVGIAMAHNGNVTNMAELTRWLRSEGLVVLSGCLGSEVNQHLLRDDVDAARRSSWWWWRGSATSGLRSRSQPRLPDERLRATCCAWARPARDSARSPYRVAALA